MSLNKSIVIIPARMGSSRFPGKPMFEIDGIPMIGHVYKRCTFNKVTNEVYVATCDNEIYDYVKSIGGKVVMTSKAHERCTDRTLEALLKVEELNNVRYENIVMVQGDEPLIYPEMIEQSLAPILKNNEINVVNLYSVIETRQEHEDPNCVKVVIDNNGNALYFSREPIPSWKKGETGFLKYKQVCVISFTSQYLKQYSAMEPTMLERVESVDMNRILENGDKVFMVKTEFISQSVDVIEDVDKVLRYLEGDTLRNRY